MNEIDLELRYPGLSISGHLYDDPDMQYISGDVFEIRLRNGLTIDVGWDDADATKPFRIVVWKRWFGDNVLDFRVRDHDELLKVLDGVVTEMMKKKVEWNI